MTAVAHLATGLLLKGRFRKPPLLILLAAAAAPDILWVLLNLLPTPGRSPLEVVRVARPYSYIGDQSLVLQPWSHSLLATGAMALGLGSLIWIAYRSWAAAVPVFLAVMGHWFLDFLVHDADLTLWPSVHADLIGPAFVLDPTDPTRGLAAQAPWGAFGLQVLVVALAVTVFLHSYPSARRHGHLVLALGMAGLVALSLPVFIHGGTRGAITSTFNLLTGAALELILVGAAILGLARWVVGRRLDDSPLRQPDGGGVMFARQLGQTAGALAALLAVLYFVQALFQAQAHPHLGDWSVGFAVLYGLLAVRFVRFNPSTWWATIGVTLLVGPLFRLCADPGPFTFPLVVVEFGLGLFSIHVVRTLLRSDLLL